MTSTFQSLFSILVGTDQTDEPSTTTKGERSSTQSSSSTGSSKPNQSLPIQPTSIPVANAPDAQDLQDLNSLVRLRCWSAIEQCASLVDSVHHVTLTPAGNAPLHSAISNGAPLSTIQALVVANPPSVALGNNFGNTPLHFAAWKNKYPDSFAIVQFLLEYYPQSAKVLNKHANLPLHHATNYKAHPDIVQLLYRSYPNAVRIPNDKGQTPLDLAIHRLGDKHPVVAMLKGATRNYVYQQRHGDRIKPIVGIKGDSRSLDDADKEEKYVDNRQVKRYSTAHEDLVEMQTDVWDEVDLTK